MPEDDTPPRISQHGDEAELYDVGPVTFQTYLWIFLMSFYVIGTGVLLYLSMGIMYITIPQGTWPLR